MRTSGLRRLAMLTATATMLAACATGGGDGPAEVAADPEDSATQGESAAEEAEAEPPAEEEPSDDDGAAAEGDGLAVDYTPAEERELLDQYDDWAEGADDDWDALLEAARAEGEVVVASTPNPDFRRLVTSEFERDTGISVQYVPNAVPAEITGRLRQEAESGNISVDVFMSGWPGVVDELPGGLLKPLQPELLLPAVVDESAWRDDELMWQDADGEYLLRLVLYVTGYPTVNTDHVDPSSIQVWDDLLAPEFSGKIAQFDPRSPGPGSPAAVYMAVEKGKDWAQRYFEQQEPVFTRDQRQLADWVAQGTYPLGLALDVSQTQELRAGGYPLQAVFPEDAPGMLTSGYGILRLFADSPNPNAAAVFANWLASPKGATVLQLGLDQPSLHTDVEVTDNIPKEIVLQEGVDYLDQNTEEYVKEAMLPGHEIIVDILGR